MVLEQLRKGQGIELFRRRQTYYATNPGDYVSTSSPQIRIEINVEKELIDMDNSYLVFDFAATQSGAGTVSSQPWEASSWIRDIRVYDRAGREFGEQTRNYNVMYRKQAELLGNDGCNGANNYLGILEGAAGRTSGAGANIAAEERAHKIRSHIFDLKTYFPSQYVGGIVLELDMESTLNTLYNSTGTASEITSYTISNVRFITDLVLLKTKAEASLRAAVQKGLIVNYHGAMNHAVAVTTNTNQRFDLGIAAGAVVAVHAFQVLDSVRDGADEEYLSGFSRNNLSSYRFRLGSDDLTERAVQISATRRSEYLIEWLKSNNMDSKDVPLFLGDSGLNLDTYFCIGQKVQTGKDEDELSGRRDYQSNKIELDMNFSSAPASATLYTNIILEKAIKIFSGREFVNL
jgi:hypothetical protein